MLWLVRFGGALERVAYQFNPQDFMYLVVLLAAGLNALSAGAYYILGQPEPFLGLSLILALVYLWSREFPNERVGGGGGESGVTSGVGSGCGSGFGRRLQSYIHRLSVLIVYLTKPYPSYGSVHVLVWFQLQ